MIHTARQTAKFVKLVRRLRSLLPGLPVDVETVAVGILERLWHFTMLSAPRGDIGRHDDDVIAESCGWFGEPAVLIEVLVDADWLDCDDEFRLVVHDWHDHAPRHIKQNIHHKGGFVSREDGTYRESYAEGGDLPRENSANGLTPNQTKPNLTIYVVDGDVAKYSREGRDVVAYADVRDFAGSMTTELGRGQTQDRRLALCCAAVRKLGHIERGDIVTAVHVTKEKQPKKPWAYFATVLRRTFERNGLDLDALIAGTQIPNELLSLPPPKCESEIRREATDPVFPLPTGA